MFSSIQFLWWKHSNNVTKVHDSFLSFSYSFAFSGDQMRTLLFLVSFNSNIQSHIVLINGKKFIMSPPFPLALSISLRLFIFSANLLVFFYLQFCRQRMNVLIIDNDIYGERFFCFPNKITSIVLLFLYLAGTNQVFELILLTKNVVLLSDYALPTHNVEIGNSQKLQAIWQKTFYVRLDIVISTQMCEDEDIQLTINWLDGGKWPEYISLD